VRFVSPPVIRLNSEQTEEKKIGGTRIVHFCLLITVFLITGLAEAQQPKKVLRIRYLSISPGGVRWEAFRQSRRELGYVEGKNIVIEVMEAQGSCGHSLSLAPLFKWVWQHKFSEFDQTHATGSPVAGGIWFAGIMFPNKSVLRWW
jgi:hypothetical protein